MEKELNNDANENITLDELMEIVEPSASMVILVDESD